MKHYSALAEKPTRTLAHVLLDIAEARSREKAAWNSHVRAVGMAEEDACTDHMAAALDRIDALTDEARAMIEDATGVSWNQISEACL